jgi:hypothetical protein
MSGQSRYQQLMATESRLLMLQKFASSHADEGLAKPPDAKLAVRDAQ